MENARYQELARKRMEGSISPEEAAELAQWLNEDDGQPLDIPASFAESRSAHENRMFQAIEAATRPRTLRRRLLIASSAAAVLLAAIAGYLFLKPAHPAEHTSQQQMADLLPAGNKAVLTLGNGEEVVLDNMANGSRMDQAVKVDSGRLAYNAGDGEVVQINTLATPRGGQFRLTLPDGTEVWLNAASKLKYPTAFKGNERTVELQGQAYFEVAKDAARPFFVKVGKMDVQVLGTSFDVMAYPDEKTVNTTLVEGSVQVGDGNAKKLLRPNQQAVADLRNGTLVVQAANIDKALAWKNGMFIFNNMDVETILREISRWYDVEIVDQTGGSKELYGGSISRNRNLSNVLKLLEADGSRQFRIEGRKVTILSK